MCQRQSSPVSAAPCPPLRLSASPTTQSTGILCQITRGRQLFPHSGRFHELHDSPDYRVAVIEGAHLVVIFLLSSFCLLCPRLPLHGRGYMPQDMCKVHASTVLWANQLIDFNLWALFFGPCSAVPSQLHLLQLADLSSPTPLFTPTP